MRSSFCSDCLSYFRKHLRSVTISYDDRTLRVITTDEADQYFSPLSESAIAISSYSGSAAPLHSHHSDKVTRSLCHNSVNTVIVIISHQHMLPSLTQALQYFLCKEAKMSSEAENKRKMTLLNKQYLIRIQTIGEHPLLNLSCLCENNQRCL